MPGNIEFATATEVFPAGFYSAFGEELRVEAFSNAYPDGSSERWPLVEGPRHFFRITRRVTGDDYNTLWTFFKAHLTTPFWFYNPRETSPPFTPDPTGAATDGRYMVVFDGNWSDMFNLGRTEVSLGLREIQ